MNKNGNREAYLLNLLSSVRRISTKEAVELLDVSSATARRLFTDMENSGKIIRNYGGIQIADSAINYSYDYSEKLSQQEKRRIGRMASTFVKDNDTIYLDCGTTLFQMTLALSERVANEEFESLNIITNSIVNVQVLSPSPRCRVILIGGEYNKKRRDFSGPLTERYVSSFHFHKSFFGCDGCSPSMGFSTDQINISSLNTNVLSRTDSSYVLMDGSKFNKNSLVSYAKTEEINAVVTDRRLPENLETMLTDANVTVYIA
jgi:DeoR/GlpR family transcriptional regulator of sugar metabolism